METGIQSEHIGQVDLGPGTGRRRPAGWAPEARTGLPPRHDALRILVHDYCGHPFQVQLSRELARRGHTVRHLHFADFQTPKGDVVRRDDDLPGFAVEGLSLGTPFRKNGLVRRWRQERLYAGRLVAAVSAFEPDVVLSANTPLPVQRTLQTVCRERSIRLVPWVQDFYSVAVETLLTKRLGRLAGAVAGQYYRHLERSILESCERAVYITGDFMDHSANWKIDRRQCHVIENWAPLDELPPRPRRNAWAARQGLLDKTCLLYTGTLGHKHNPRLLLELAEAFRRDPGVAVVCIAEGPGRVWLEAHRTARRLTNLVLLDFQPYQELPDIMATGDVLIALIERDAGVFAVPSKVLSYLCAERALLLAVPQRNLAARTVERSGAGITVDPMDLEGFTAAARRLVHDPALRARLASNARRYAEATFDIRAIADRFEDVLFGAVRAAPVRRGANGASRDLTMGEA